MGATNLPKAPVAAPAPAVYVEPTPTVAEEKTVEVEYDDSTDDMEVIAPVEESVANTLPYVAAPVVPTTYTHQAPAPYAPYAYGYAPHQGYYQAPVAPVVQHTPVHAPV